MDSLQIWVTAEPLRHFASGFVASGSPAWVTGMQIRLLRDQPVAGWLKKEYPNGAVAAITFNNILREELLEKGFGHKGSKITGRRGIPRPDSPQHRQPSTPQL